LNVEFPYYLTEGFMVYAGECTCREDKTIRFNGAVYKEDELGEMAWYIILHEITHIKILGHSREFWAELENNFNKTMDLRQRFYYESGLDGDSYYDLDYATYEDECPSNPDDVEYDYENLFREDDYFEVYAPIGEIE
ncbi:MAG: M48 family metallopeptidase, partial [Candidatus Nanoarchaeia archaeon]|nr:M48 family metallopeptidase [Candidatus Nanoarchaeia archaeon]